MAIIGEQSHLRKVTCAKSLQACQTLHDHMDHSLPGSSVHVILQARILEWIAISFSRGLPDPEIEPATLNSPAPAGSLFLLFLTTSASWGAAD